MTIPFSIEQFYGVFTAYNSSVWPMQLLLLALGVLAIVFLVRQRHYSSLGISATLTALWVWQALVYHLTYFAVINPLAYVFAAVFVAGAAAFFWQGVIHRKLIFKPASGWRAWAGWGLIIFALLIYPAWTYLAGHRYPAFPTFGLPCPSTLFTIGLLAFLVKPYPRSVFIVPILWCLIGSQAAFAFEVQADLGLIVAGILGLVLIAQSKQLHSNTQLKMPVKANITKNGIWLTLPPLLFSLGLMAVLPNALTPAQFNKGISQVVINIESIGRILVFAMPAFFSVGLSTTTQKRGLAWYLTGLILYSLSYGTQNFFPNSDWSTSTLGFAASAFTNAFWLIGLGLLGEKFYFTERLRYHPIFYIAPAVVFVAAHTTHAVLYRLRM